MSDSKLSQRIGEISFDLSSVEAILMAALAMLSDSDNYGSADAEDGAMLSSVGQILMDTRKRIENFSLELSGISDTLSRQE